MSHQVSFWQRVGNLFRGGPVRRTNGNGRVGALAPLSDGRAAAQATAEDPGPPPPASVWSGLPVRWGRREPSVGQMRDGYQRIVEMMDALQEHFRRQDERAQQLGQSVERMTGILEQLGETAHSQQGHIRSIADNVNEAGRHAAAMSAALSQMPRTLQLQAEAVRTMLRQIEISQESDTQLMHSLQQLSRAVDAQNASSAAQVQTLERLDSANREQKAALSVLVREQGRRFVIIILAAALLGLGALAALTVALALQLSR